MEKNEKWYYNKKYILVILIIILLLLFFLYAFKPYIFFKIFYGTPSYQ